MIAEWLQGQIVWGAAFIERVQSLSSPALDAFFIAITYLGQEPFFLLLVPAAFWCVGKGPGLRLAFLLLLTAYVNLLLKGTFMEPRPYLVNPDIEAKLTYSGYAFPSGHAQTAATLWPALARHVRRAPFTALSVLMVLLIAFSRVYLGVHYPHDVIAGLLVGLGIYCAYLGLRAWMGSRANRRSVLPLTLAGVAIPALLLTLYVDRELRTAAAALVGATLGFVVEDRTLNHTLRRGARFCLARLAIGLPLVAAGAHAILATLQYPALTPAQHALRILLYAAMGAGFSLGMPWLFVRIGLARAPTPIERSP